VSTNPLHVSSFWSLTSECGTKSQPLSLKALTGQRIRIDLLDFSGAHQQQQQQPTQEQKPRRNTAATDLMPPTIVTESSRSDERSCLTTTYGYVAEQSATSPGDRQKIICGDGRRERLVMQSEKNAVDVVFDWQKDDAIGRGELPRQRNRRSRPIQKTMTARNTSVNFLLRFYGNLHSLIITYMYFAKVISIVSMATKS
jgi:hypothetical protein